MSIIGHRTHYKDYPNYRGLIVGTLGPDLALVEWDDTAQLCSCYEPIAKLVVLDETEVIDDEPATTDGGC